MTQYYWHFTDGNKLRDGRTLPAIGEWLIHEGKVEMCKSGLHASPTPFDALQYAPGSMLHKVELEEIVESDSDKVVARKRKIVASYDVTELCRTFARKQALSVIKNWKQPVPDVVVKWLNTGDENLRSAARSAAWSAAAWSAAWSAESAAWSAAWSAESAARSAAWSAAWSAESAARSAAWSAAWSAESAAWSAESAARSAAWSAARTMFNCMVEAL